MVKILLDTDIGSDIDDAVCLAYLLANPQCELLGITTVSGEADRRASMASAMCMVAGRDVPVFPGAELPFLTEQKQPRAVQAARLVNWKHRADFPKGQAVGFMRDTIRKHPGEIVLLGIGPLTNIALLFSLDPEIPSLLKSLVLMCGVFTNRLAGVGPLEWNARCDPYAAAIVYRASVKVFRSVGLDVTMQVSMGKDEVRRRFGVPLLRPVLDFADVWFQGIDKIIFHDPLAAATIFDERICQFERGTVDIELADESTRGLTRWSKNPGGRHEVAMEIEPQRFFDHYFGTVGAFGA